MSGSVLIEDSLTSPARDSIDELRIGLERIESVLRVVADQNFRSRLEELV